jgi:hypothetical protein
MESHVVMFVTERKLLLGLIAEGKLLMLGMTIEWKLPEFGELVPGPKPRCLSVKLQLPCRKTIVFPFYRNYFRALLVYGTSL